MLSGDDLTIALFLVGTGIAFAAAAMSAAGWRHPVLIWGLFVLAGAFVVAGFGWSFFFKSISPLATSIVGQIAQSPVVWFVLLVLVVAALTLRLPSSAATADDRPTWNDVLLHSRLSTLADSAELRLHTYGDERSPTRISSTNIWRWYSLRLIVAAIDQNTGGVQHQHASLVLFIVFEQPVVIGTLEISSPDFQMPRHEVKEFTNRYAIVVFSGELPAGTLEACVRP
jgi:hypothetical protein